MGEAEGQYPYAVTWGPFLPSRNFSVPTDLIVLHWTPDSEFPEKEDAEHGVIAGSFVEQVWSTSLLPASK